ncbi:hypothetical protein [Sporomusa termitida]|uniref:Uncharacterized protein n=1 Tax=Sporomusa termitida TaxID=2377 RepID=A0A517DT86_9FIRM|nr:hypothetical protein [Sporomusa termitida]QDR80562.1 hypothetical protein SPTER_18910 [Sporomusa termitida]
MAISLLGYTIVDSTYSAGTAGAIGANSRTDAPASFTAYPAQVPSLNGDPSIYNYRTVLGQTRVVIGQYDFVTLPLPYQVWDPATVPPWSNIATNRSWPAIKNLYSVATRGYWLYPIDYDWANIAVVNMLTAAYPQTTSYTFPAHFDAIEAAAGRGPIVPAGNQNNGVAIVANGTSIYALFTTVDDPWATPPVYQESTIVRMSVNLLTGALTYTAGDYVKVGKNASTLELSNGNLYVCAIGGGQQPSSANAETRIDIVDLSTFPAVSSVTTAVTPASSGITGDYRDISIINSNNAFVLAGHFINNFGGFTGGVYRATLANIAAGNLGTKVVDIVNAPDYFWAIAAEDVPTGGNDRLWFVRGNPVEIYSPLPVSTAATPARTFAPAALGTGTVNVNINSITLIQPSLFSALGEREGQSPKTFVPHAILAKQARSAAKALGVILPEEEKK